MYTGIRITLLHQLKKHTTLNINPSIFKCPHKCSKWQIHNYLNFDFIPPSRVTQATRTLLGSQRRKLFENEVSSCFGILNCPLCPGEE